ncbi:putative ATP-dependent RNA helicase DDX56 [Halotydeus destructor]|nr:putative ATP-dependent RNA helicase DDX56 [Halotydeus destructor]
MSDDEEKTLQFSEMGLDGRLLKSISDLGWNEPTLIQEKAIPLALDGKDILARGRTGCGKTAAFLIPIINRIIDEKKKNATPSIRAVILAPSKELTAQIASHCSDLNKYTSNEVSSVDIGGGHGPHLTPLVAEKPDILIATPSKLLFQLKGNNLVGLKSTLRFLTIDEADLMFSFGYESDIKEVIEQIVPPNGCQSFLVSATLNPEVGLLKKLILTNPVTLKLEEADLPESDRLTQYHVNVEEEDKFVVLSALFKLKLIRGRTIIFVKSVDRCYKLKLFLEQFGIRACILNSELPVTSRCHVVSQFNAGTYDIIIASDEKCLDDPTNRTKHVTGKRKRDKEFGVARGIDFQFVSNVVNFDFPNDANAYIHRVGRTARGARDAEGTALSFISISELPNFEEVKKALGSGANFKPYQFKMSELDGFKYRTRDALRAVTSIAVREARIKEIKREMLTSEKLKGFFSAHPKDLKVLRHDRSLHTVKHQQHLKDVPDYIIPATLRGVVKGRSAPAGGDGSATVSHDVKRRKVNSNRSSNPLKTFSMNERRKRK